MMAPQGIGAGLIMKPAGGFADRHGSRGLVAFGAAVATVGTFAYTQVTGTSSFWILAIFLFVRGLGIGMTFSPVTAASYRGLSHHELPRATTATNIMRQLGGSLGVAIFAVVLQKQLSSRFPHSTANIGSIPKNIPLSLRNDLAAAFAHSFWWSFATCALTIIPPLFLVAGRITHDEATSVGAAK